MEADSRLNNNAMKGEGTVGSTKMTAATRTHVHIHTVTAIYMISFPKAIYTIQSDGEMCLSIYNRMHVRVQVF